MIASFKFLQMIGLPSAKFSKNNFTLKNMHTMLNSKHSLLLKKMKKVKMLNITLWKLKLLWNDVGIMKIHLPLTLNVMKCSLVVSQKKLKDFANKR